MKIELGDKIPQPRISLGGDPEFEVVRIDDQEVVYADALPQLGGFDSPIGLDGSGAQVELRPEPAREPDGYVKNVWFLINAFHHFYGERYCLWLQGDVFPLGGHIHVGSFDSGVRTLLHERVEAFIRTLDCFVGRVLLPTSGVARGSYKRLGGYELKSWGWEYRTPPSSFYADPEMVRITYKLVKKLVCKLLQQGELTFEVGGDGIPLQREYERFLTQEEASFFLSFPKRWNNWGDDFSVPYVREAKGHIFVSHSDEWDTDKFQAFKNSLKYFRVRRPVKLVLYGLKKERGEVWALETAPTELQMRGTFPKAPFEDGVIPYLWVGVPYRYRRMEVAPKELLKSFRRWIRDLLVHYELL